MTVPVSPGDVIDGTYVIEKLLGEGGMGAVFIAREERLGRRVAIKVLLSEVAKNPEAVVRFEREARSAAALHSDHVTRVLSVGHLPNGSPYIVMELLEGEDLAATLANRGPLPGHEVIGFMTPVCEALSEAHALGIVHRDLKPANVFLSRRGGLAPSPGAANVRVKVLDFGISKSATGTASASLTATTALMGTPLYMSPEQLREARNVDGRADIWALGIMMYELLTGKPPFVSDALAELCVLIMTSPHAPLIGVRPDVGPALDAIVNRCLQKNPTDRFATVEELMAALATVPAPGSRPPPQHAAPPRMATPQMYVASPAGQTPAGNPRPMPKRMATPRMYDASPAGHVASPPGHPMAALLPQAAGARAASDAQTPPFVPAATVDPVSSTQPWLPPKRPNALGLALVFVGALAIGGVTLYALVLRPTPAPRGDSSAAASGASGAGANADPSERASAALATSLPGAGMTSAPPAPSASAPPTPAVVLLPAAQPPPVALPPPVPRPPQVALPPPVVVAHPAVVTTAAPSARVAPSARPSVGPSPHDSLMPGQRKE